MSDITRNPEADQAADFAADLLAQRVVWGTLETVPLPTTGGFEIWSNKRDANGFGDGPIEVIAGRF